MFANSGKFVEKNLEKMNCTKSGNYHITPKILFTINPRSMGYKGEGIDPAPHT